MWGAAHREYLQNFVLRPHGLHSQLVLQGNDGSTGLNERQGGLLIRLTDFHSLFCCCFWNTNIDLIIKYAKHSFTTFCRWFLHVHLPENVGIETSEPLLSVTM